MIIGVLDPKYTRTNTFEWNKADNHNLITSAAIIQRVCDMRHRSGLVGEYDAAITSSPPVTNGVNFQ
jgi:hypothetical protein